MFLVRIEENGGEIARVEIDEAGGGNWLLHAERGGIEVNTDLRGVAKGDVWRLVQRAVEKVSGL